MSAASVLNIRGRAVLLQQMVAQANFAEARAVRLQLNQIEMDLRIDLERHRGRKWKRRSPHSMIVFALSSVHIFVNLLFPREACSCMSMDRRLRKEPIVPNLRRPGLLTNELL